MDAANLIENEKVQILNLNNGELWKPTSFAVNAAPAGFVLMVPRPEKLR
jgi:aspartate 1-decarboxylase